MRWMVFALAAFLALALDGLVGHVLAIRWQGAPLRPGVLPVLAVFVTLAAPRLTAMWACLILGLLVDLATPLAVGDRGMDAARLIGPNALGFVFGGYFVYQIRAVVFRRRALTIGVLSAVLSMAASLVAMAFYVARTMYVNEPVLHWKTGSAGGELIRQLITAIYCGAVAVPLGWLLLTTLTIWGFHGIMRHRSWR